MSQPWQHDGSSIALSCCPFCFKTAFNFLLSKHLRSITAINKAYKMKAFIYCISLVLALTALPAQAKIDNLSQAINESGRLRMLTQRMAKAYLLKALDIQPAVTQQQFTKSVAKFEQNISELKIFSAALQDSAELHETINEIEKNWDKYKKTLMLELDDYSANYSAKLILKQSDLTLMACEKLVVQLEKTAQRQSARWVNLSGRQRMLSQRIAKLYTAISLSSDNTLYHKGLKKAVSEFDKALQELTDSPDNTHYVNHKLKKVATQWNFSKQGFRVLSEGSSTPLVIFMTTESILKQMNDITALYEEIDNKKKHIAKI